MFSSSACQDTLINRSSQYQPTFQLRRCDSYSIIYYIYTMGLSTSALLPSRKFAGAFLCLAVLLLCSHVLSFAPSLRSTTAIRHFQTQGGLIFSSSLAPSSLILQSTSNAANSVKDDVYTIQILMSDTGGGHRASANAIRDALDTLHPGKFECDIVDIYTEYGPFWPYNGYVAGYKLMAKYPWTWDLFYHFGETDFGLWLNDFCLTLFCFEPFKECMARPSCSTDSRADMVVSVHPLTQGLPLKILKDLDGGMERTTPFATVVTDLGGAAKSWFHPDVDKCFVPSNVLNEKAQSMGLDPISQIVQYGLPIRRGFWSTGENTDASVGRRRLPFFFRKRQQADPVNKDKLREQLGLNADLPTCLIVGGGDGMGGIVQIASTLGKKLGDSGSGGGDPEYQMVVVCGSNKEAKETLERENWGPGVAVDVQGFVNNMDEWMNAADCLVTKAGPGTIAEASICGLPCMLFAFLPGQEEGNVPFVEDSGFGKYSSDPSVIADTVSSWLASPEAMEAMKESALAAARPAATLDIARDLAEIAFSTRETSITKEKELIAVRR